MIEAMKQALEALEFFSDTSNSAMDKAVSEDAITAIKEALREHAMREVQRLGQEIEQSSDYERGFIDGMQKQMQSSVDKAVNAMSQRTWVGLTDEERNAIEVATLDLHGVPKFFATAIEAKLKELNT